MAFFLNFYRKLLSLPLSILVKSNSIPNNPIEELHLNINEPLIYVLPYTSQTDLLIFQKNCLSLGLPDPLEMNEINGKQLPRYVFLDEGRRFFKSKTVKKETEQIFSQYLEQHRNLPDLDVQLIPVSVLWGRSPGYEDKSGLPKLRLLNGIEKFATILWFGRDNFVRFSQAVSLRYMVNNFGSDQKMAQKLARVARIHFSKQRISATGPRLLNRSAMFAKLLSNENIMNAIY